MDKLFLSIFLVIKLTNLVSAFPYFPLLSSLDEDFVISHENEDSSTRGLLLGKAVIFFHWIFQPLWLLFNPRGIVYPDLHARVRRHNYGNGYGGKKYFPGGGYGGQADAGASAAASASADASAKGGGKTKN